MNRKLLDVSTESEVPPSKSTKISTELNAFYENLAFELDDGNQGHFLSGWQCENPFSDDFLAAVRQRAAGMDPRKYAYFDEIDDLPTKIASFHKRFGEKEPQSILCGCGSSALLFAFIAYLRRIGIQRVHYLPPIYFTLHTALELFGFDVEAVSTKQPYEDDFALDLPLEGNSVLIISDPVWYAGIPISDGIIQEIAKWQRATSSIVLVDGSQQYLAWTGDDQERTATLDLTLTFRLISPSKQLCVHGYRFAYLLLPESQYRKMAWTYANIHGPAGIDSIAFAYEAIDVLVKRTIPRKLMSLVSSRHSTLRTNRITESRLSPSCGYLVFERINTRLPNGYIAVDGKYFDQKNYPGYVKINLLSPSIGLIMPREA